MKPGFKINENHMNDAEMRAGMNQGMAATASMQLGVQVLQANSMELDRIVRLALEKNPVLELETPADHFNDGPHEIEDSGNWDAGGSDEPTIHASSEKRDYFFNSITEKQTLGSFLHEQASLADLKQPVADAAGILIDSLDHRGFFEEAPEEIAKLHGIDPATTAKALEAVRKMDPPGVGARDLRDSLLIQLAHSDEQNSDAAVIIRDCWEELVKHQYDACVKKTGIPHGELSRVLSRIGKLNPDPGEAFSRDCNPDILPDIIVEQEQAGDFEVTLTNEYVPHLKLSNYYKDTLSENYDNAELRTYLKKAFKEGRELIRAIDQRQHTILNVSERIVAHQRDYFEKGPKGLKPMQMGTIADELGIHVSTVSRAVAGKFMLCKWGIKELRSFFDSGVSVAGDEGGNASSSAVHEMIRDIIAHEPKGKPLSDQAIARALEGRGVGIARRTVAKYREQMKILPASMRKTI